MVAFLSHRAHEADEHAWDSALRPKQCLLALHPRLRAIVTSKLILDWSPEQISGWLKTEYPDDGSMHVSHETIYRSLFIQARGVLKKRADRQRSHLRSKRRMRRSRHATVSGQSPGSDRRCHLDPRKACGSGRPSDSWSLGRRSAERRQEQLHCDTGRTPFTLCHVDQGAEQRNGSRGCCLESACS